MKTYYDILGISRESSKKDIKTAYRKLVKRFHPDVNRIKSSASQSKIFEEINLAYSTLIHPDKRKEYDISLSSKKAIPAIINFKFRELKNWLFSLSIIKLLLRGKNIVKNPKTIDSSILALSVDELLKRVIYSKNIYVQTNAVRAVIAKKRHYAVNDLLRLLYSNIDDAVKIEIIEGLKEYRESKVKNVIREIYDIEKSFRVRQTIRNCVRI